ncbi:DUF6165 family protein [Candidatus Puniceispirillum marinum]|uniref:Uncharacterized protein n=1 Tax=Puniceispirillum marinum (strain IMCC1322) TaxID=488538 RepID=D5BRS9_PUNMI|nr:DUF6165 family protein [Candidatus Puniceispirillum marinum]ADE38976.1 hypothetical protein SAR116_0732 [Candidatus Puniceispirillum marinum IMCC1322]
MSVGEVLDKITILEIKLENINDTAKLANVETELSHLRPLVSDEMFLTDHMVDLIDQLKSINKALWDIEDDIRIQEYKGDFGSRFIELARAVYVTNDERAHIKKQINLATGSVIVEEKSYEDYSRDEAVS